MWERKRCKSMIKCDINMNESPLKRIFEENERKLLKELAPLWKFFPLDDPQFLKELAEYIRKHAEQDNLEACGKEIVVYYAGWWRCLSKSAGGEKDLLISERIGINDPEQIKKLKRVSRESVRKFNLPTERAEHYTLWQASLFAQGGIPQWMIVNGEDSSVVRDKLIQFLNALYVDWEDYKVFHKGDYKALAQREGLAHRYQSEALFLSCHSIIEDLQVKDLQARNEILFFKDEEWARIKAKRESKIKTQPFRMDWTLRIDSNQNYSIRYRPYCPQHILLTDYGKSEFRVYLNDSQYIGGYYREDNDVYRRLDNTESWSFEWHGESYFRLSNDLKLLGAMPPNLDEPLFFGRKDSDYLWGQASDEGTYFLYNPSLWQLITPELDSHEVNGLQFYESLMSFAVDGCDTEVKFEGVGEKSGESICFVTGKAEQYELSLDNIYIDWIKSTSHTLLPKNPTVGVYGADNEYIISDSIEYNNSVAGWQPYNKDTTELEWGWVKFRAKIKDRYIVSRPAFFIGNLEFKPFGRTSTEVSLSVESSEAESIIFTQEQNPLLSISPAENDNSWKVRLKELNNSYPSAFNFELRDVEGRKTVKLSIAPQFKGNVVVKNDNQGTYRLSTNSYIALSGLHLYQAYCFGVESGRLVLSRGGCRLSIPRERVGNVNSLANYRREIEEFRTLYGISDFDDIPLTLSFGDRIQVNLVDFNLTILQEDNKLRVYSIEGGGPILFEGKMYIVPSDGDLCPEELVPIDQGYSFGVSEEPRSSRYVVFSSWCSQGKVKPQEIFWGCDETNILSREELLKGFAQSLLQGNQDDWSKVLRLLRIVYQYYLPLATFYQIEAACSNEHLFGMLLFQVVKNGEQLLLSKLLDQVRDELTIAPEFVRNESIERITVKLPEEDLHYIQSWLSCLSSNRGCIVSAPEFKGKISVDKMDEYRADIPERDAYPAEVSLPELSGDYYKGKLHNSPFMNAILKAPFVLYEHHLGKIDLWEDEHQSVRRVIHYCQKYYPNYFYSVCKHIFNNN